MSETNPWLSRSAVSAPVATVSVPVVTTPVTGPLAPQHGVAAPDEDDRLPMRRFSGPAPLWCVGAHGGAGESSLAALVPGWRATGHAWPVVAGQPSPPVVVVARTHVRGLEAARAAAVHWASGGVGDVQLVGLVLVADVPGKLPKPLKDLVAHVSGAFPRVWSVPWVEAWRLGEPVRADTAPRAVTRLVQDLDALTTGLRAAS